MDYSKILTAKVQNLKPSGIRRFFDLAEGSVGVISLGVGEPDFNSPWNVRAAAAETLRTKRLVYTSNSGYKPLRDAISEYTKTKTGVEYAPESEIVVTVGGSEAIDITVRACVEKGDEVLIPEPCFVCYNPIVTLCGGVPVSVPTTVENGFKLTANDLITKITSKTKLLILPYPNNPTGAIMTEEDLKPIAEILRGTNILVLSDEIYGEITYGRKHASIVSIPDMRERTVLVNGFSKTFAMTGWRLGYLCAPKEIVAQVLKIHQYAIMCSPTMSQYAAIEALTNCDDDVNSMRGEYETRRNFLVAQFNRMGLNCFMPGGAFYVFPSIKSTGLSSEEFCTRLLEKEKVAVVPGNAFGDSGEGFVRVSYAYAFNHLKEAVKRIEKFLIIVN